MRGELLLRLAIPALIGLALAAFHTGPGILDLGEAGLHWWNSLAWFGSSALAMAACMRTGARRDQQSRAAWLSFGLACGCWLAGSLIWAAYDLWGSQAPFPGLPDAGYLLSCLLFLDGMFRYGKARSAIGRVQACNLALAVCAVVTTAFVWLFPDIVASESSLPAILVAFLYPALWFGTAAFGLIYLVLYAPRRRLFATGLLLAGILAQGVANLSYALALMGTAYRVGSPFDGLWVLCFLLVGWAAVEELRQPKGDLAPSAPRMPSERHRLIEALIPAGAVALILLSGIWGIMTGVLVSHPVFWLAVPLAVTFAATVGIREHQILRAERKLRLAAERSSRESAESRQQLLSVLDSTTDCVLVIDRNWRITYMNQHTRNALSERADLLVGLSLRDIFAEEAGGVFDRQYQAAMDSQVPVEFEAPLQSTGRWYEVHAYPKPDSLTVFFRDITERRKVREQIEHMAHHDALTGLANRRVFRERLREALGMAGGRGRVVVMHMDLDHFKEVNDTLGHPAGDALLVHVARQLRACVCPSDIIARLGGDEFAVICAEWRHQDDLAAMARRLIEAVSTPCMISDQLIRVGASVGVAVPETGIEADALFRRADIALYAAKAAGRGRHRFFEPAMEEQLRTQQALKADLSRAMQNSEFELAFQPIIDLASNEVRSFEALLRWRHPGQGWISPGTFVALAEETGFIIPLGEWVLHRACVAAAAWPTGIRVAVNLSPCQFQSANLPETVADALARTGLSPDRLELEITESVLLQHSEANLQTLNRLRGLGVRIALDDFGTGYSSLSYLQRFPFNRIKVDRSFVMELPGHEESEVIVRAITDLGRSLGMAVTAEGVETRQQLDALRVRGCDEAQGYFFSKPIAAEEIDACLTRLEAARMWWSEPGSRRTR
ncbi:EAL domain-containing protein [Microvirga sp. Mcv34]|uniref:EAL domain-containing protein n=1 Tax=Microvirga sp. Mcv34 TaxID=2926016 RepID=UPI0021C63F84|nr:EAL domain-containing protein [Microvirga sp. Mcv34]